MKKAMVDKASSPVRESTPDQGVVSPSQPKTPRQLSDNEGHESWLIPPFTLPSTHTPSKKTNAVAPLKGILKKAYTLKKSSGHEELANQLGLKPVELRDASEVLAERKKRKRSITSPSSPETSKSRKKDEFGFEKPKPKPKQKLMKPEPPIVAKEPTGYKVAKLFPSGEGMPKKVTFGHISRQDNGGTEPSALLDHSLSFDHVNRQTVDSQHCDRMNAPILASTLYTQHPREATNALLVHNTQEVDSAIARLSNSPSLLDANQGHNGIYVDGTVPSPSLPNIQRPNLNGSRLPDPPASSAVSNEMGQGGPLLQKSLSGEWGTPITDVQQPSDHVGPFHDFVPLQPLPTPAHMRATETIWRMIPPATARRLRVPPTGVDSTWLDVVSAEMWKVARNSPVIYNKVALYASSIYSFEKLRVLGLLGYHVSWWCIREGLVWTLLLKPADMRVKVDDRVTVEKWRWATARIRDRDEKEQRKRIEHERSAKEMEETIATEFATYGVEFGAEAEAEAIVMPQERVSETDGGNWSEGMLGSAYETQEGTNEVDNEE